MEVREDARPLMDVCGTGGDKHGLFNISTAAMFVVAACGVRVVKHGNRGGVTSKCGGADVLEALDVRIELEPAQASAVLDDIGCVFLFAPIYHPAFKAVGPVRKALAAQGVATIFNKLGPLLNPVNPPFQLAGVFDPAMVATYGDVFAELGRTRAWAVHGRTPEGGLDEMSTLGETGRLRRGEWRNLPPHSRRPRFRHSAARARGTPGRRRLAKRRPTRGAPSRESPVRARRHGGLECRRSSDRGRHMRDMGAGLALTREAIRNGEAAARLDAMRAATKR